ncbi:hypothetical protein GCM10011594_06930 [Nakamurella endophytica]|uniref:Uncharacterized protein n=1 Tax=Nakamurella endophytica TaxID=1748367 RepID=A0A917SMW4_9ACTN|nr:hypothetical protein GCM10011594_06930 [Nakamurella endophytica]
MTRTSVRIPPLLRTTTGAIGDTPSASAAGTVLIRAAGRAGDGVVGVTAGPVNDGSGAATVPLGAPVVAVAEPLDPDGASAGADPPGTVAGAADGTVTAGEAAEPVVVAEPLLALPALLGAAAEVAGGAVAEGAAVQEAATRAPARTAAGSRYRVRR